MILTSQVCTTLVPPMSLMESGKRFVTHKSLLIFEIASKLPQYRGYPRIVGETGGKDFIFAHPSAHVEALVVALVRGAFEYAGQKCSACSRAYVPKSLWPRVKEGIVETLKKVSNFF